MIKLSNNNYDLNRVLEDESLKNQDSPKSYAFLQLLLPIKRLIDIETSENWFKDGSVWPFYEK